METHEVRDDVTGARIGTASGPYTFLAPVAGENIVISCGGVEKIRVTPDGFYVDGVKVSDDPERLYAAMCFAFKGGV